jgi:hypothetical protein
MGNGASASEIGAGIGKGFASLVGMGDYVSGDQISDLNNTLSDSQNKLNETFQNGTIEALKNETALIIETITWAKVQNSNLTASMDLQNDLLTGSIQKENMFTILLGILVLIIIFFMIIKKKCC